MKASTKRTDYVTPTLRVLGTVKELTDQELDKCTGSADATLPRNVPTEGDFNCGPF